MAPASASCSSPHLLRCAAVACQGVPCANCAPHALSPTPQELHGGPRLRHPGELHPVVGGTWRPPHRNDCHTLGGVGWHAAPLRSAGHLQPAPLQTPPGTRPAQQLQRLLRRHHHRRTAAGALSAAATAQKSYKNAAQRASAWQTRRACQAMRSAQERSVASHQVVSDDGGPSVDGPTPAGDSGLSRCACRRSNAAPRPNTRHNTDCASAPPALHILGCDDDVISCGNCTRGYLCTPDGLCMKDPDHCEPRTEVRFQRLGLPRGTPHTRALPLLLALQGRGWRQRQHGRRHARFPGKGHSGDARRSPGAGASAAAGGCPALRCVRAVPWHWT